MKNKKIFWRIVAAVLFALFLTCAVILAVYFIGMKAPEIPAIDTAPAEETTAQKTESIEDTAAITEPLLPDNPIDFAALQQQNSHIYAWIKLPGTEIDYPIVQHPYSEEYYLRRNYLGEDSVYGCIFSQYMNSTDFSDPNTLLYGHYMPNGTYFGALHNFRDPQYFENNRYFYVYIPGHILTYEVFAAYEYDNRHILYAFDFTNPEKTQEYFNSCLNPTTMYRNVLDGYTLTADSKIVTLSTCLANADSSKRYLVQGALVNDEITK